jgi:hypothetical protein
VEALRPAAVARQAQVVDPQTVRHAASLERLARTVGRGVVDHQYAGHGVRLPGDPLEALEQ